MRKLYILVALVLLTTASIAQDGKILDKTSFTLADSTKRKIAQIAPPLASALEGVNFFRITYLSDGLKVKGVVAEPKAAGKYPVIIVNRGGNREFGKWDEMKAGLALGNMASWGYVVVASQYRGVDGGDGMEEFGGKDINDVMNLFSVLPQLPKADTSKIGMEGGSRGGMMTYLALKKTCRVKAAVIRAGAADLVSSIEARPEMETHVYAELIPNYRTVKDQALKDRSAVYWADQLCKSTPLLILHGTGDWRVSPNDSFTMVQKLYQAKHPVRFVLYEGADHGLTEVIVEALGETRRHFDAYLKNGKKLPDLSPHGR